MSCKHRLVIGLSAFAQTRNRDFWRVQEFETRYPIAPEKNLEVTKFDKQKNFNYKIQLHNQITIYPSTCDKHWREDSVVVVCHRLLEEGTIWFIVVGGGWMISSCISLWSSYKTSELREQPDLIKLRHIQEINFDKDSLLVCHLLLEGITNLFVVVEIWQRMISQTLSSSISLFGRVPQNIGIERAVKLDWNIIAPLIHFMLCPQENVLESFSLLWHICTQIVSPWC